MASTTQRTVLFVHGSDELYGSDRCLLDLIVHLPERFRAVVALPTDIQYQGTFSRLLRERGVTVYFVDMAVLRRIWMRPLHLPRLVLRSVRGTWQLRRIIRHERAQIVHSNTLAVVCGSWAARMTRRPHVWHIHEIVDRDPAVVRLVFRGLVRAGATRVIAVSHAVARSIAPGRDAWTRTVVVYDGVAPLVPLTDEAPQSPRSSLRIIVAARLTPGKGIGHAIRAAAILRDRGRMFHLTIAGDPPPMQPEFRDEYAALVASLDLQGVVTLEGYIPEVRRKLGEYDILLVPSPRPEPLGLVLLEGMAAGCAVVACRNGGGSDELLQDGVTGLYCDTSPESIAEALDHVLDDAELRAFLGGNARRDAMERFSLRTYVRSIVDVYDDIAPISRGNRAR